MLVPVLAFTGDMDNSTAIEAFGSRLLVIVGILGFMMLAISYYYRRRADEMDDE